MKKEKAEKRREKQKEKKTTKQDKKEPKKKAKKADERITGGRTAAEKARERQPGARKTRSKKNTSTKSPVIPNVDEAPLPEENMLEEVIPTIAVKSRKMKRLRKVASKMGHSEEIAAEGKNQSRRRRARARMMLRRTLQCQQRPSTRTSPPK